MGHNQLKVIQELNIENNLKIIVYEGYYLDETTDPKDFENVVCFDGNGIRVWKVNGMNDFQYWNKNKFSGVGLSENKALVATDQNGFVFEVNKETGKATFLKWVK